MVTAETTDLKRYCLEMGRRARRASSAMVTVSGETKNRWLARSALLLRQRSAEVLEANAADLARRDELGLTDAQADRLRLDADRLEGIAASLEDIARLADPIGAVIESSVRPNGLEVMKVRVPLGVIFFVYESRPNVTADAAALCVKSGNAVILRGGKEAFESNRAVAALLREAADDVGLPADAVQLVETPDREAVSCFLGMKDQIDLTIPRGGKGLIERVVAEATMPVLKHFEGICHLYVDATADRDMARRILLNAKCQRPGVCNAVESLLVHERVAQGFFLRAIPELHDAGVELRICAKTRRALESLVQLCTRTKGAAGQDAEKLQRALDTSKPSTDADYRTEYLAKVLAVKVVESLAAAIEHINAYGSKHTDAIVTSELAAAKEFAAQVDSAAVMVNASTRFNDGGQFGMGAEIGISTDKFHARGPCGLKELTSYKYVVYGNGQIRQ
jgi:glutamate-5-semialdehyde dehydrogenase